MAEKTRLGGFFLFSRQWADLAWSPSCLFKMVICRSVTKIQDDFQDEYLEYPS